MAHDQVITMAQVRWNSMIVYGEYTGARGRTAAKLNQIRKKAYQGQISEGARKRMAKAVDLMIQFSRVQMKARPGGKVLPFRLGFVTLTVPGRVRPAKEVHQVFKKFLDFLRYRDCLYVWKAEYQVRGQVHYHLIINQWIHYRDLQHGWNSLMKKAGFLQSYAREHGHFNPNSTDVRAVKSSRALEKYLLKYLQKGNAKQPINALAKWWGASATLLGKRYTFEPSQGDYYRLAGKPTIKDPHQRWMIVEGDRKELLTKYQKGLYINWRAQRKKAGWKPTAPVKQPKTPAIQYYKPQITPTVKQGDIPFDIFESGN